MKKNYIPMIIMLIFSTLMMVKIFYTNINPDRELSVDKSTNFNDVDSLFGIVEPIYVNEFLTLNKFNYVHKRFSVFNRDLDTSTVITFNKVCCFYGLDSTEVMLELCVGQILLESGAKQYYETSHPKEGQLVESYAGAVGFSQIVPLTAYYYLTKNISDDDTESMVKLGAEPFDVDGIIKADGVNMARDWLMNETNNIILWGYIMRSKLNKRPNILKALVSYNSGTTGMINYVNGGGLLSNHKYVKGIQTALHYTKNNS